MPLFLTELDTYKNKKAEDSLRQILGTSWDERIEFSDCSLMIFASVRCGYDNRTCSGVQPFDKIWREPTS